MNTEQIVALLAEERDRLNRAIEALQGPVVAERRGRPPKSAQATVVAPTPVDPASRAAKKRAFSSAHKKALSKKLKAYWKKRRAEEANQ
jgi:hypothetical protein